MFFKLNPRDLSCLLVFFLSLTLNLVKETEACVSFHQLIPRSYANCLLHKKFLDSNLTEDCMNGVSLLEQDLETHEHNLFCYFHRRNPMRVKKRCLTPKLMVQIGKLMTEKCPPNERFLKVSNFQIDLINYKVTLRCVLGKRYLSI